MSYLSGVLVDVYSKRETSFWVSGHLRKMQIGKYHLSKYHSISLCSVCFDFYPHMLTGEQAMQIRKGAREFCS